MSTHLSCYIIAGEPSGDLIGARLIKALRKLHPGLHCYGIGGPQMQAQGVKSLFPMEEISLMGFVEIVPHLPTLLKRVKQTVADIEETPPDILITIDSPGFCKQVVKRVQGLRQSGMQCVHYVAPTVWAYKPDRAQKFAALYDHMLCLLPFEPRYFENAGLQASFVGHPVLEESIEGDGGAFRARHGINPNAPLLCLLPGSRKGEQRRHLPVFRQTVEKVAEAWPEIEAVTLAYPGMEEYLAGQVGAHNDWCKLVPFSEKADMFAASTLALSKSGTVTLELAMAGVPMVMTYKANPLSVMVMRYVVQTRFVNLMNILAGREIVPELLQEFCRESLLSKEINRFLAHPDIAAQQVEESQAMLQHLIPEDRQAPSVKAAEVILSLVEEGAQQRTEDGQGSHAA